MMRKSDSDKGPIANGTKSNDISPKTPKRNGSKKSKYVEDLPCVHHLMRIGSQFYKIYFDTPSVDKPFQ